MGDALNSQRKQLVDIGRNWIQHFNSKDLDKLLDLYDDKAVHYSPRLRKGDNPEGRIVGKEQLRQWWQDSFDSLPNLRYDLETILVESETPSVEKPSPSQTRSTFSALEYIFGKTEVQQTIFIKYKRTVSGQPDMYVAEEFKVRSGKIVESRVYLG